MYCIRINILYISYCSKRNFHLTTHTGSCPSVGRLVGPLLVCHLYWSGSYTSMLLWAELRSHPIFGGSGSHPSKIKRLRLRLLVNCKAENYEFVTTKKYLFMEPEPKLRNFFGSGSSQKGWLRAAPAPKLCSFLLSIVKTQRE